MEIKDLRENWGDNCEDCDFSTIEFWIKDLMEETEGDLRE